jgi:hypothetical protein
MFDVVTSIRDVAFPVMHITLPAEQFTGAAACEG